MASLSSALRRKHWPIRLRESEKAEIERAAAIAHERPATWAREVLLAAARAKIAEHAARETVEAEQTTMSI